MTQVLVNWVLSALLLLVVARVIPGFTIVGLGAALFAAVAVGFLNSTLGLLLKFITFPITILTLGLFWWVVNAIILKLAAMLVPGFRIDGFLPAFFGALFLSLLNVIVRAVFA